MQCNYNSFIQIINFHGIFRNALRCRNTGACRILVPLRYLTGDCLVYIDSPTQPLPRFMRFQSFRARVFIMANLTPSQTWHLHAVSRPDTIDPSAVIKWFVGFVEISAICRVHARLQQTYNTLRDRKQVLFKAQSISP